MWPIPYWGIVAPLANDNTSTIGQHGYDFVPLTEAPNKDHQRIAIEKEDDALNLEKFMLEGEESNVVQVLVAHSMKRKKIPHDEFI